MKRKTSDVLQEARVLINRPEKWRPCSDGPDGTHCMVQAVSAVAGEATDQTLLAEESLALAIEQSGDDAFHRVTAWNDAPGRTYDEVMEAFDTAISLAMSDEAREP